MAGNDMGGGAGRACARRSLGLEPRTLFTGLLKGRDRLEALADAEVVVYPSQDEIFGLVPLEALLAGTPVIVADDSGCGEVVQANRGRTGGAARRCGRARSRDRGRVASPAEWRAAASIRRGACQSAPMAATWYRAQLEQMYAEMIA